MRWNNLNARFFSGAAIVALAVAAIGSLPTTAQASPASEISKAVMAAGASSVAQASASQFIQGFSAVVVRAKVSNIGAYVTAAIKLRPDLASAITVAAIGAHCNDSRNQTCEFLTPIIQAAIAADPAAKNEIVRAAIQAYPGARQAILAAAGMNGETEMAFFRPPGVDAGNVNGAAIGTMNPANISSQRNALVITPERP